MFILSQSPYIRVETETMATQLQRFVAIYVIQRPSILLIYHIAHQKSFGSSVATAPDQFLKSHGAFLLCRGPRCDCTFRRSPYAFFFPLPNLPVTQKGLYGGESLGVKLSR